MNGYVLLIGGIVIELVSFYLDDHSSLFAASIVLLIMSIAVFVGGNK